MLSHLLGLDHRSENDENSFYDLFLSSIKRSWINIQFIEACDLMPYKGLNGTSLTSIPVFLRSSSVGCFALQELAQDHFVI